MMVLVLGCNHVTSNLVPELVEANHQVTVLGEDRNCLEALAERSAVNVILTTEPAMIDYLQQAGITHADAFLALSQDDHQNALAAQIASHIYNVPKVVCHLDDPQMQILYAGLGLDVVGHSFGLVQDIRQVMEG